MEVDRLEIAISADAKKANAQLKVLIGNLNGVSTALRGGNSALNTTHISAKIAASSVSKLSAQVSGVNLLSGAFKGLMRTLLPIIGIRAIFNWGKNAMETSSQLTEVQNVIRKTYGDYSNLIEEFAADASSEVGMSELTAKQIASRYQAMGTAMGIAQGQMANMSVELTKLAGNMASFYDADVEDVGTALQSVFTGQTRALRQYGIDITQASIQEWAMKKGIDANMQSMTQASKALLRYNYILEATNAIGDDFRDTIDTWHNQTVLLKQAFITLSTSVGGALINIFKPLLTWLNSVMTKVIAVVENIINALGFIFGWQFEITGGGEGVADSGVYDDLGDSLDGVADGAGDADKNLGSATKSAKELRNTLLSFDEINRLDADTPSSSNGSGGSGSGGSGGSGSGGGAGAGDGLLGKFTKREPDYQKYISDIKTLEELGKYIGDSLQKAMLGIDWSAVYDKLKGFGKGLADFLNGLITPELFSTLGATIANSINAVLWGKNSFLKTLKWSNLGASISAGINGFFATSNLNLAADNLALYLNGLADAFATAAEDLEWSKIGIKVSAAIRRAIKKIEWEEKVFVAAKNFGTGLAEYMNGLFNPDTFKAVGDTIAQRLNTALHLLDSFGDRFEWGNFGNSIASGVMGFFNTFDFKLLGETFNKWALGILASLRHALGGIDWKKVGQKINELFRTIEWDTILSEAATLLWEGLNDAVDFAKGLFDGTPFTHVFETIQGVLADIQEKVNFKNIAEGFTNLAEALSPFVAGFAQGLIDAFGFFSELGLGFLEGLANIIYTIADGLKMIPTDVLETIGRILGEIVGFLITMKVLNKTVDKVISLGSTIGGWAGGLGIVYGGGKGGKGGGKGTGTPAPGAPNTNNTSSNTDTSVSKATGSFKDFINTMLTSIGVTAQFHESFKFHVLDVLDGTKGKTEETDAAFGLVSAALRATGIDGDFLGLKLAGVEEPMQHLYLDDAPDFAEAFGEVCKNFQAAGGDVDAFKQKLKEMLDSGAFNEEQAAVISAYIGDIGTSISNTSGLSDGFKQKLEGMLAAGVFNHEEAETIRSLIDGVGTSVLSAMGVSDSFKEKLRGMLAHGVFNNEEAAIISELIGDIGTSVEGTAGSISTNQSTIEGIGDSFSTIGDDADSAAGSASALDGGIAGFGLKAASRALLMAVLGTAYKNIGTKAEGAEEGIDSFETKVGGLADNIAGYASDTKDSGEKLGRGTVEGMEKTRPALVTTAEGLAGDIISTFEERFDEHSPSKVSEGQGYNYGLGMANGLDDSLAEVSRAVSSIADTIIFGMPNNLYGMGQEAASSFARGMRSIHISTPHMYIRSWNYNDLGNGGYQYTPNWAVQWYANGGFPNRGEMFVANENGIEMMGKMGNKNVVANNSQITEGIAKAVASSMYSAVSAALRENAGASEVNVVLEGDAKGLFKVVRKEGIQYQQMTGRAVFN